MSEPTFSVIVPTYNRAVLVQRTLKTVFDQQYPAHEIIVVDNCSTDGTVEALRPLRETGHITFVKHPENRERAASRNTGLDRATGDFVTFLDSDDLMYPANLADAASFIRRYPDAQLFHNLFEHVDQTGELIRRRRFPSLRDPLRAIAEGNFMSCIGNFIRRDLYMELRFDPDPLLSGSEDWEFWLRAMSRTGLGRIRKFNSGVVSHGGRTVEAVDLDATRLRLERLIEKVFSDSELARVYAPHRKRLVASKLLLLASAANSARKPGKAWALLAEVTRTDPRTLGSEKAVRIFAHATIAYAKMRFPGGGGYSPEHDG